MMEAVVASWQARIRAAVAARTPLRIRGGGTKDFYGQALAGDVLDTTACEGIVDYDPTELVITVRAGTRLAHVERTMRAEGQMLACEPPRFGEEATIGGFVAAGLSGPRRPYAGAVRDLVLGVRIVDGKGDDLRFGGRVMKNVAGFDVARLMTGALGTLGVITEVSLRCMPMPKAETTRVFQCSADEAIRMTNEWGGKPLPDHGDCVSRRSARGAAVGRRARGRGGRREDRRHGAARQRPRRRVLAQRARADAAVLSRRARSRGDAVASLGQVDGAVHGSRRRPADRVGRRAALAPRERAHRRRARSRVGARARRARDALSRGRQDAGRLPAARRTRCTGCTGASRPRSIRRAS